MCEPNGIAIHLTAAETFHLKSQMSTSRWCVRENVMRITKRIRIHCLETINVCTRCPDTQLNFLHFYLLVRNEQERFMDSSTGHTFSCQSIQRLLRCFVDWKVCPYIICTVCTHILHMQSFGNQCMQLAET